ncbi:MAG: hypothetical protein AVDCRST_MAG11-249, partial [uncultured Gemmatimonadaceae bacterium]
DAVELRVDLAARHPDDRALEVHVLASGEVGVEAGGDLQQRARPTREGALAARGAQDAGEQLEDGRLPRPVGPDDAQRLAGAHDERDVLQRPEATRRELRRRARPPCGPPRHGRDQVAQAVVHLAV